MLTYKNKNTTVRNIIQNIIDGRSHASNKEEATYKKQSGIKSRQRTQEVSYMYFI